MDNDRRYWMQQVSPNNLHDILCMVQFFARNGTAGNTALHGLKRSARSLVSDSGSSGRHIVQHVLYC